MGESVQLSGQMMVNSWINEMVACRWFCWFWESGCINCLIIVVNGCYYPSTYFVSYFVNV